MLAPACAFTLGDAIAAAERHSADYAAAVYESKAAQEKPIQARAALLPQVNANVLHQHQPESVSASTRSRGWSIQAEQALFDRGRWLQYKQGKITAQSANFQLRHAASETAFQAARAYFDVLSAQEQLVAVRDERQAFEQQVRQAQAMFQTGAATKIDVQEAMSGYDAAVAKEMAALNRLQLARSTLSEMTGLDAREAEAPAFPSPLPDILQDRPQTYWQENADRNNPELAVQRLAAANARIALSEVRARHLPRLSASAGYQDYHSRQEYGGRGQNYRSRGATVSVQLTLPLFNSGLTVSQSREAAARLNQHAGRSSRTQDPPSCQPRLSRYCWTVVSEQSSRTFAGDQSRQIPSCGKRSWAWFEYHPAGGTGEAGRIGNAAETRGDPLCLAVVLRRTVAPCRFA